MAANADRTWASNWDEIRQLLEIWSNHEPTLNPFPSDGGARPGHEDPAEYPKKSIRPCRRHPSQNAPSRSGDQLQL